MYILHPRKFKGIRGLRYNVSNFTDKLYFELPSKEPTLSLILFNLSFYII